MSDKSAANYNDIIINPYANSENMLGHGRIGYYGFSIIQNLIPTDFVVLALPPQSLQVTEDAATVITPMQGGAKLRERRGQLSKVITLSGTTGFRPRQATGVERLTSIAVDPLSSIPAAELPTTGFIQFHKLRNLFRKYWEVHRTGTYWERSVTNFAFFNPADNEQWIVEPMSFQMQRDKGSPMTRRYNIPLQTLAPAPIPPPMDPIRAFFKPTLWQSIIDSIRNIRNTIVAAIKAIQSVINDVTQIVQSLVQAVLGSINDVLAAVDGLIASTQTFLNIPAATITQINGMIWNLYGTCESLSLLLPTAMYGGLIDIQQSCDALLARPDLFSKPWEVQYAAAINNYTATWVENDDIYTAPSNISGVMEGTVSSNETFSQLAHRLLGSAVYTNVLAMFNGLSYPYISASQEERAPGTLAPGDVVLVPIFGGGTGSTTTISEIKADPTYLSNPSSTGRQSLTRIGAKWRPGKWKGFTLAIVKGVALGTERLITDNTEDTLYFEEEWGYVPTIDSIFRIYLKRFEDAPKPGSDEWLGRDLQITEEGDLNANAGGDLAMVAGMKNLQQAFRIKMRTMQGELPVHSWFGVNPAFGERGNPDNLFRFRYNVIQTFLSDNRVESVDQLSVKLTRDVGELEARVKVRGAGFQPIKARL